MIFLKKEIHLFKAFIWIVLICNSVGLFAQPYFETQLSGSLSPSPLDLRVGTYGDIQIWRDGNAIGQLYEPNLTSGNGACGSIECWSMTNGVFMLVDTFLIVSWNRYLDNYNDIFGGGVSGVSGAGTEVSPWQISVDLGSLITSGYGLNMVYSYVNGNDYIDISMTPILPASNTGVVKVFHIMDTYLSSSDDGPAYVEGTPPYDLVGVSTIDSTAFEAFVVTEDPWDRYCSHHFYTALNEPLNDGELSNTLDTGVSVDNAIGVQWTLGAVAGTQPAIKYRIGFSNSTNTITNSSCAPVWMNRHIGKLINGN